jgi:hypothetical protein
MKDKGVLSNHFCKRLKQRLKISQYRAWRDALYAIRHGNVLYCKGREFYMVIWWYWVYVISNGMTFVTVFRRGYGDIDSYCTRIRQKSKWRPLRILQRYFNTR